MPRFPRNLRRMSHPQPAVHRRELPEGQFTPKGRLRRGILIPRSTYRRLIVQPLLEADQHTLRSRDIRSTIKRRLAGRFSAADLSLLPRGQPRWVNAMQWERKKMVMEGLLETTLSSGHSTWQLTREGVRTARAAQA